MAGGLTRRLAAIGHDTYHRYAPRRSAPCRHPTPRLSGQPSTSPDGAAALGERVAVSRIILGCGNFGGIGSAPAFFGKGTSRDDALRLLDEAWELGIRTLDTADAYGGGRSETVIGEWLATRGSDVRDRGRDRDEDVQPDERGRRPRPGAHPDPPSGGDEPRAARRRADPALPRARLRSRRRRRRRRSSRSTSSSAPGRSARPAPRTSPAEQLAEALELSALEGLTRYEWVQNAFSLLEQGDRETVFPLCHEHGIGFTPFSPLAGGWLTGKYRRGEELPPGSRMTLRPEGSEHYRTDAERSTRSRHSSARPPTAASRWPRSRSPGSSTCRSSRRSSSARTTSSSSRRCARRSTSGCRQPSTRRIGALFA